MTNQRTPIKSFKPVSVGLEDLFSFFSLLFLISLKQEFCGRRLTCQRIVTRAKLDNLTQPLCRPQRHRASITFAKWLFPPAAVSIKTYAYFNTRVLIRAFSDVEKAQKIIKKKAFQRQRRLGLPGCLVDMKLTSTIFHHSANSH